MNFDFLNFDFLNFDNLICLRLFEFQFVSNVLRLKFESDLRREGEEII